MSATNKTANYDLPQWIGSDHPTWQGDLNSAFLKIDETMKANADEIASVSDSIGGDIQYFTMTCDIWDKGTLAAKQPETEETPAPEEGTGDDQEQA